MRVRAPLTLTVAARLLTSRGPRHVRALIAKISRTFDFPTERANRLKRFIEIAIAYKAGHAVETIRDSHGCTRSTILRYARIANLPKRPKHFAVDVRTRVIRLYKARKPVAEIAARCGVSPAYVSKTATEEGINRKPQRRRKAARVMRVVHASARSRG